MNGKGFLGSVKSLFVEEDNASTPATPAAPAAARQSQPGPPPGWMAGGGVTMSSPPVDSEGKPIFQGGVTHSPDPKAMEKLTASLATVSSYSAVMKYVTSLKKTIPDEGSCFRTAISLVMETGVSAEKIFSDFEACSDVLIAEEKKFMESLQSQATRNVEPHRAAALQISDTISGKQASIAAIQLEIQDLEKRKSDELQSAAHTEFEISEVRSRFSASLAVVRSQLESQRLKIATYGKGT